MFWVGILGTIGSGLLIGVAAMRLGQSFAPAIARREPIVRTTLTVAVPSLALMLAAVAFLRGLAGAGQPGPAAQHVQDLYASTVEGLERRRVAAPLVRVGNDAWSEAAGTLLQLHKRGVPFVVERESLHMFGSPLAAKGCDHTHVLRFVLAGDRGDGEVIARAGPIEARLEPRSGCATGP